MNKRQRRKTEKNLRDFIDKKKLERQEIEVGDTVEVIKNDSLEGHPAGTVGVVSIIDITIATYVRVKKDGHPLWSFLESVRLVKKGTRK